MTRYGIDPVDEAIYDTAHGYLNPDTGEKGVAALARKTGRNGTTLYKKVDPFVETHLININELRSIMNETNNFSAIETLAMECGYGTFLLPDSKDIDTKKGILDCILIASVEGGEACKVISEALSDNKITAKEATQCSSEINDQINALIGLRQRIINAVVDPNHLPVSSSAAMKPISNMGG